jgi:hypothetical protein
MKPYDIDKDEDVQKEIVDLEALVTSVRRHAHRCDMTTEFLDNIEKIGKLNIKYSEFVPLPKESL